MLHVLILKYDINVYFQVLKYNTKKTYSIFGKPVSVLTKRLIKISIKMVN